MQQHQESDNDEERRALKSAAVFEGGLPHRMDDIMATEMADDVEDVKFKNDVVKRQKTTTCGEVLIFNQFILIFFIRYFPH